MQLPPITPKSAFYPDSSKLINHIHLIFRIAVYKCRSLFTCNIQHILNKIKNVKKIEENISLTTPILREKFTNKWTNFAICPQTVWVKMRFLHTPHDFSPYPTALPLPFLAPSPICCPVFRPALMFFCLVLFYFWWSLSLLRFVFLTFSITVIILYVIFNCFTCFL